ADLHADPRSIYQAFDTTRFDRISSAQLASSLRTFPSQFGTLRADGVNNLDSSATKHMAVAERLKLQLGGEFFNSQNHPEFNPANLSPASTAFGAINQPGESIALRLVW